MGMNIAKGNMYDFVTHTWNTVKGACPHDCSYCYMKRFGKQKPVHFDKRELKTDLGEGNFIFVGSSCDMFADGIKNEWIVDTLEKCNAYSNRYLFQSKHPMGMGCFLYDHYINPDKVVVCTTIETNRWYPEIMMNSPRPEIRTLGMKMDKYPKYVTIEPIMDFDLEPMVELIRRCEPVQVNIGADSGNNRLPEPSLEKIMELVEALNRFTVVAKKRNLSRLERA